MITLKMADQRRSGFCVVFTISLCALELKQTLISLPIEVIRLFKLDKQAPRSYLKLTCEYELHILPNTEVRTIKDHGKSYMKVRPPMVRHLLHNRLLDFFLKSQRRRRIYKWSANSWMRPKRKRTLIFFSKQELSSFRLVFVCDTFSLN